MWKFIAEVLNGWGLWPGHRCPNCNVKPGEKHEGECPTGEWDGGTWA